MATKLHNLVIKEVSLVDDPANPKAHVVLAKRKGPGIGERLRKFLFGADGRSGPVTAHQAGAIEPVMKALDDSLATINAAPADQQAELVKATLSEFSDHVTATLPADLAKSVTAGLAAVQTDEPVEKSNDGADAVTIEELKKALDESNAALAKAKKVGDLSDAHKATYNSLSGDAQDKFLAGSDADRTAMAKTKGGGEDDAVAKARDAETAELRKNLEATNVELQKLRDKDEQTTFSKRATEIGLPEAEGETLRKARKGDVEAITKLEDTIKALHAQVKKGGLFSEIGKGGQGAVAGTADAELVAKADEIRKSKPSMTPQQAYAQATKENPALFAKQREEARAERLAKSR